MPDVRAILVSDIHLQARAPVARSTEPDWFAAMLRPLEEIGALAERHDAPVLYAGDIFDRWNSSPEVINFAIKHLPRGHAVPGQHDLPNHNYDDIKRSAYWTLVEAGRLVNLEPGVGTNVAGVCVYGWPWGFGIGPPTEPPEPGRLRVAVCHAFIYTPATGYPGAPPASRITAFKERLAGYDVAAFGDNHKGFIKTIRDGPTVINCGGLMCRKVDEVSYEPGVGLLLADGTVERHLLDCSEDMFIDITEAAELVERALDMTEFVSGLRGLGASDALDFVEALKRFLDGNNITDRIRSIVLEASGK